MIRYSLKCSNEHTFESWFKSAEAFEGLQKASMVACPHCGSDTVEKTLMAPGVPKKSNAKQTESSTPMAANPDGKLEKALAELKAHVESNSDYVGSKFAAEATAMHNGEVPERSIYGEVKPDEAKKMAEDGVPAVPLPFIPKQKTN
ncbi:MAG: DUF1178 family protein [Boseongicola sp.]|nr:DUF1178 family protein [Boseongicola sp.]MDD9976663.1 DUF1178 family protein [Boseongicola sp.]